MIVLLSSNVSAFFTRSHETWMLNGLEQTDSSITSLCRNYKAEFLDGNTAADVTVLHYADSKVTSYIFTHTRAGYTKCMEDAGSDPALRCFCYGVYLHNLQDSYSHLQGGVVEQTLKKYFGSNYMGHMTVERNFQSKHMQLLEDRNDYVISSGQLDYYDSISLNTLFENGEPSKYLDALNNIAGIDLSNDAKIFRSAYQGEGFYNTVYKDKIALPSWFYIIAYGLIIVGILVTVLIIGLGRNKFKYFAAIFWILLAVFGVILLLSFYTGSSWKITTFIIETPPKFFNYLGVTDASVKSYDKIIQDATNQFLTDGVFRIDDASGLTYCANTRTDGTCAKEIKGALTNAETGFNIVFYWLLTPLFVILNIWSIFRAMKAPKVYSSE